jgi:hypothetical protein
MPNWCYTDFSVSGPAEHITRFREAVRGADDEGETPFDFNRLIPMPSELHDTHADLGTAYEVYYSDEPTRDDLCIKNLGIETADQLREHFDAEPKHRETADQWRANIQKYGAPTWYEWRCGHWGTKWNAYHPEIADNEDGSLHASFDTAWSFPFPIFQELVAAFPQLLFEGLAYEPSCDFHITFEGRSGKFTCKDDPDSREAAAAAYEHHETSEVTA